MTILYVLIWIFILGSISFAGALIFTENPKYVIGVIVSIILACICICMLPNKEPFELYQEKVEAVEKANKDLEKFLIDYPEFKKEWNKGINMNKSEMKRTYLDEIGELYNYD